ncbi:MAG: LacI family DNA-binding transcriptional regulator [Chloroflexota bacterium]
MSRPTLKDVAAKAGVSYQTVSKVLNRRAQVSSSTEKRVMKAIEELNYRPNVAAQNLRQQHSNLIGYAWGEGGPLTWRPINNRFLHSVVHHLEEQGYLVTFFTNNHRSATNGNRSNLAPYKELFGRRQVDGFVLEHTVENDPRIAYLIKHKVPFVAFGRVRNDWDFHWVDVDGYHGIVLMVDYLLAQGHKRIGLVHWQNIAATGYDRKSAYFDRLKSVDIIPHPNWLFSGINEFNTGAQAIHHYLSLPKAERPTAVICVSDQIAVGAISTAISEGLQVGQDIAITGYDDVNMARYMQPPLTTIRQPIDEAGTHVARLLLAQIHGQTVECKQVLLKPELVVRQSA